MYYKIPLNKLLPLITIIPNEFIIANNVISLDTIMSYIDNNEFIEKQNKNSYEQSIYNILLSISNPDEIHDNKIVIERSDHIFNVSQGIEKIIAALYHKEEFVIIKSNVVIEESIGKYSTIESIDYSFTSFTPILDNPLCAHDTLNNEYIEYRIESVERNNDSPWDDKNYIMSQVKANRLDIKDFIPVGLLDESFILELIDANYNVLHNWYDILEEDYNRLVYKTFLSLTENKKPIFIKYIDSQIDLLLKDIAETLELESTEPREVELINEAKIIKDKIYNAFCKKEDLLDFIISHSDSRAMYNLILILPNEVYRDQKITFNILTYFNYRVLQKLEPDFFKNEENVAKLFISIDEYLGGKKEWVYDKVCDFFQDNAYSYVEWYNNEVVFGNISNIVAEKRSPRYYFNAIFFKKIYSLLSINLKKNVNCLYNLLRLKPDSFATFDAPMRKEKKLIDYYLQNGKFYEIYCPVGKEYLFTIENPELVSKIVNSFSYLLFEPDCPLSWTENIEHYRGKAIIYLQKFPEHIKEQIFSDYEYVINMLNKHYYLYSQLPLQLRMDRKILDIYINNSCLKDLKNIPQTMLLNKAQCFNYFKINPHILSFIPDNIKNSISFILQVFHFTDNKKTDSKKYWLMVNECYPSIVLLIKKFNKENELSDFLKEHFEKQRKYDFYIKLDANLDNKISSDTEIKKTKL